jgi:hypothetical protein
MKVRTNHLLLLPLTLFLLFSVPTIASPPITGKGIQVKDGDTAIIYLIEDGSSSTAVYMV